MSAPRSNKIAYWITTLLVLLPVAGSGIPEVFTAGPASTVQILHLLGYPLYLKKILGTAKLLGAITLLANRPARLVEWAYAGFTILFLGAASSHVLAGDVSHAPPPLIILTLLLVSYWLHRDVRVSEPSKTSSTTETAA